MSESSRDATTRERPILFSGEMVRAILEGRKTQTRRVVKPQPNADDIDAPWPVDYSHITFLDVIEKPEYYAGCGYCPHGQPGDRLWVRESFSYRKCDSSTPNEFDPMFWYWADGNPTKGDFTEPKPSVHMPRIASRLTLEVTGIRVERVQDITEAGAIAEGIRREDLPWDADNFHPPGSYGYVSGLHPFPEGAIWPHATEAYRELWDSLNHREVWDSLNEPRGYGWDENPYVWVIEFCRLPVSERREGTNG